ncbi:hypothetical protein LOSG293_020220 [Secundilactobacillus oryzae JCM 18671]|uniref:Glyoxalase n=1 Tax=Secundilactobacillus oryzae JCM 18671 TaxID=1291743 RepID=A0A081BGB6_9LACO|nr:hypothetical protein [Secundilactobacillus oryzae]GAK47084.1 hypothetical protein LOSG293_020220 [Secundilactobacillus oryzae JCM 18671]
MKYFGFEIVSDVKMVDGSKNVDIQVNEGMRLSLFSRDFIKQYSPEVLDNEPSLLFTVTNFEELHQKLANQGIKVGDIVPNGPHRAFNFPDNEGRYYGISEG